MIIWIRELNSMINFTEVTLDEVIDKYFKKPMVTFDSANSLNKIRKVFGLTCQKSKSYTLNEKKEMIWLNIQHSVTKKTKINRKE